MADEDEDAASEAPEWEGGAGLGEEGGGGEVGEGVLRRLLFFLSFFTFIKFPLFSFVFTITGSKRG